MLISKSENRADIVFLVVIRIKWHINYKHGVEKAIFWRVILLGLNV